MNTPKPLRYYTFEDADASNYGGRVTVPVALCDACARRSDTAVEIAYDDIQCATVLLKETCQECGDDEGEAAR